MSIVDLDAEFQQLGLHADPIQCFQKWFSDAKAGNQVEPEAMCISSFDPDKGTSSRMVLMRRQLADKFYFFTNYESRKSFEFSLEARVSLLFHWRLPFHRQVRIEGRIQKASTDISDEYFFSRPYQSQISAWASPQSQKVESREQLEELHRNFERRFESEKIVRPSYWGGWEITPQRMEFWQEREHRFHDRLIFERDKNSLWAKSRIAP